MKTIRLGFILLAVSLLSGCGTLGGWFGGDDTGPQPAPLVDIRPEVKFQRVWSAKIGSGNDKQFLKLVPAVLDDRLFAASADGTVVALDRLTGKRLWRVRLKAPISGGVEATAGLVLLGTIDSQVVALDAGDGSERWRARLSSEVLAVPRSNGAMVVVQTLDEKVFGLDHATGQQRWFYESLVPALSLRGTSSPAVNADIAVVGLANGRIVALNVRNGQPLWEKRIAIPQGSTELERLTDIDGDILLVGTAAIANAYQGNTAVIEFTTSRTIWQRPASSTVAPAEGFGNIYVSDTEGNLQAFDQANGQSVWVQAALAYRKLTAPVSFVNYVAVGDFEGYLHLVSQVDGRFVARRRVDGAGLLAAPLAQGGLLYVYGNSGKLEALRVE